MTTASAPRQIQHDWQAATTPTTPAPVKALEAMGRFYVHNAIPMKGHAPDAEGRCQYLLQCFQLPADATPGQIREMQFDEGAAAQYRVYRGHVARHKGQSGLTVGYVYDCMAEAGVFATNGKQMMVEAKHVMTARPQVRTDLTGLRFGRYHDQVQDTSEHIETNRAIDAIRCKQPAARMPRNVC